MRSAAGEADEMHGGRFSLGRIVLLFLAAGAPPNPALAPRGNHDAESGKPSGIDIYRPPKERIARTASLSTLRRSNWSNKPTIVAL